MKCPYCFKSQHDNAQIETAEQNCDRYAEERYKIQCINPKCKKVFALPASRIVEFGKPYKTVSTDPSFPQSIEENVPD